MDTVRRAEGGAYKMWRLLPVQVDTVFICECEHGITTHVDHGRWGLAREDTADHWHVAAMGERWVDGGGIGIGRIE